MKLSLKTIGLSLSTLWVPGEAATRRTPSGAIAGQHTRRKPPRGRARAPRRKSRWNPTHDSMGNLNVPIRQPRGSTTIFKDSVTTLHWFTGKETTHFDQTTRQFEPLVFINEDAILTRSGSKDFIQDVSVPQPYSISEWYSEIDIPEGEVELLTYTRGNSKLVLCSSGSGALTDWDCNWWDEGRRYILSRQTRLTGYCRWEWHHEGQIYQTKLFQLPEKTDMLKRRLGKNHPCRDCVWEKQTASHRAEAFKKYKPTPKRGKNTSTASMSVSDFVKSLHQAIQGKYKRQEIVVPDVDAIQEGLESQSSNSADSVEVEVERCGPCDPDVETWSVGSTSNEADS